MFICYYKMALMKLPNDIQNLLCASIQINSYKRAIEELVYNSLDASSTSIAIRIHIEDDTIQVVDNGHGITKRNFSPLGQKYMTSKYVDMNTLKSAPNTYGFRGESLANIIKISQNVKIMSRHESGEETWIKCFCNGKEQVIKELTTRPSKGTTVEVKGFLYNLCIQKKATDSMNVIQDIKTFLEQLSLVHSNISLSLREDSKNEIAFKMHKNRDIYQTLSSLFGIDKSDFQELKVEKKHYKVTGFIGNNEKEIGRNWIYLNGKILNNSKLHKIINDIMAKSLREDQGNRAKIKTCKYDPELFLLKNKIPFYFIFVICPYIDYDISYTSKKSVVEFKDWEQIKKLLEKLIKFYTGDINLKEIKKPHTKLVSKEQEDTRYEVRKIIEKILGNSKKIGVSQMQKGIKGKHIKRKTKKKPINKTLNTIVPLKKDNECTKSDHTSYAIGLNPTETHLDSNNINSICDMNNKKQTKAVRKIIPRKSSGGNHAATKRNISLIREGSQQSYYKNKKNLGDKKILKKSKQCRTTISKKENLQMKCERKGIRKIKNKRDLLYERFENPTDSLKERCDIIAKKAEYLLQCRKKSVREIFGKQTQKCVNKPYNNKIDPVYKKLSNIHNHIHTPLPPFFNRHNIERHLLKKIQEKPYKTTYDLVNTILNTQKEKNTYFESAFNPTKINENLFEIRRTKPNTDIANTNNSQIHFVSKLTFESHNYYNVDRHRTAANIAQKFNNKLPNTHFITETSRDNFKLQMNKCNKMHKSYNRYLNTKKALNKRTMILNVGNSIKDNRYEETSYTIEFSEKNHHKKYDSLSLEHIGPFNIPYHVDNRIHTSNNFDARYEVNFNMGNTYTVLSSALFQNSVPVEANPLNDSWHGHRKTYTVSHDNDTYTTNNGINTRNSNTFRNGFIEANNESMLVFSSNSQRSNAEEIVNMTAEPLNICETILSNHDSDERVLNNKESNNVNNNEVVDNIFKDIVECMNDPNFDEGAIIMNHDNEPNNHVINESLNIKVCKEKSDYTRDDPCEMEKNVSHHFDITTNSNNLTLRQVNSNKRTLSPILSTNIKNLLENEFENENTKNVNDNQNAQHLNLNDANTVEKDMNTFILKNRLNFVPKGMSPIFANCNNKDACDYDLEMDYYQDNIYNNFANDVQVNSEVFEPRIENIRCLTTKDIDKVNNKLDRDNASLIFNGASLKEAKVLGQVDGKFIAAVMKGVCNVQEISEFLILFDQHAVHERIRLENNLSDYIDNDKWKSIPLDDISLKMSKDEVLYLHNYMEKFDTFGLQWTFLSNCEISINAIPEAILGKNPRPVDKVIKAVKNLISEEINMIKLQKGCVSLYPKSIMDLVFSEACRYAIKFGDKLTNNDCMELLNALSKCKTPFQCAHGRPVMAVLMDYKCEKHKYEVKYESLKKFYRRKQ